ncbi:gamma-aminobutyric acid receptor subunit alpha-6-like isoform X2 [Neocloeon triangulifer]|uniref:gamma-aminobutyric acid receptor subunit alpha-6-like isoform X2 n=1 Tax=Neocloeon triangulifer TaxID=2078957 RepID=UPI00286F894B|nr:gamma-aminobutyric acid receptor subunit alpha-6-like isoform X2 [Neocloeon triangulifer]
MLWGLLLLLLGAAAGLPGLRDHRQVARNVTRLLDDLLATDRYDKRIRPDFGGPPVKITVNMYIKSIGPVSETDEWYAMDCYFRQKWYDSRLQFNLTGLDEFSMNWLFLERVWKPDTFFMNGKKSYLHRITVPNKFLRIRSDGFLTYSMRLTIKASCKMHLRKFPLDSQNCPLTIGSYGYSASDVLYEWLDSVEPVGLEPGVSLAQYDLVNITTDSEKTRDQLRVRREDFSVISVNFHLKRMTGYFMLQVYVPCGLIVSCSWVSFWIDPDAVPARVSLGVTTVLSMTTMGFGGRSQMPKVSYRTALDWFVILCFSFVFAVMVEYACINFIDTLTEDLKKIIAERRKQAQKEKAIQRALQVDDEAGLLLSVNSEAAEAAPPPELIGAAMITGPLVAAVAVGAVGNLDSSPPSPEPPPPPPPKVPPPEEEDPPPPAAEEDELEVLEKLPLETNNLLVQAVAIAEEEVIEVESAEPWLMECACSPVRRVRGMRFLPTEADVVAAEGVTKEKFSKIDIQSRKYFPLAFTVLITIYWVLYMYYITDEVPES